MPPMEVRKILGREVGEDVGVVLDVVVLDLAEIEEADVTIVVLGAGEDETVERVVGRQGWRDGEEGGDIAGEVWCCWEERD